MNPARPGPTPLRRTTVKSASPPALRRVAKKLSPGSPGTARWLREYGEQLVCVRYRQDVDGEVRTTTVELVVEQVPLRARAPREVAVRLPMNSREMRSTLLAAGGRWDSHLKLWFAPKSVARALGLATISKADVGPKLLR